MLDCNGEGSALAEAERVVNERYLDHCLHNDHSVWTNPCLNW